MNLDNIVPDGLTASTSHNVIHGFVNGAAVIVNPLEQSDKALSKLKPFAEEKS